MPSGIQEKCNIGTAFKNREQKDYGKKRINAEKTINAEETINTVKTINAKKDKRAIG